MLTDSSARMAALNRPFESDRIEWRIQSSGLTAEGKPWARVLAYITQRAAFERLDEVYGESWSMSESFNEVAGKAVCVCKVEVALPGEPSRIVSGTCEVDFEKAGDIDPFKTAASGALKRAVVALGIGRYLYQLDEAWAEVLPSGGLYSAVVKDKAGNKLRFTWNPPRLPNWALPGPRTDEEALSRPAAVEAPQDLETPPYEEPEAQSVPPAAAPTYGQGKPRQPLEADPVIPFGRSKGSRLSELSLQDLDYFANKWEPRPWEKTGKVTARDQNLKDRALDLYSKRSQPNVPASDPRPGLPETDEVPF